MSRRLHWILMGLFLMPLLPTLADDQENDAAEDAKAEVEVYFSPKGGITKAIVDELADAEKCVKIQARVFTSPTIAKAVADAQARGVEVVVMLDKAGAGQAKSVADPLQKKGVTVLVDGKHKVANSKNIIIDDQTIITGSFDLTPEAELENAETLVVIEDAPAAAAKFVANFEQHRKEAEPFDAGKTVKSTATQPSGDSPKPATDKKPADAEVDADGLIDPNTATREQLMTIKGIGPSTADNIIAYREENGTPDNPAFKSIDDLTKVKRIGKKTAEKLAPFMKFPESSGTSEESTEEPAEASQ